MSEAKTDKWHIQSQANNYAKVGREGHLGFIVLWRDAEGLRDELNRLEALAELAGEMTRCDHTDGFDLVTEVNGEMWESPWSWCPHCGTLLEVGAGDTRTPDYHPVALATRGLTIAAPAGARAANTEAT